MTIKSFTYIVYSLRLIGAISKRHISGAYISYIAITISDHEDKSDDHEIITGVL
jgi:hypothetical protein